MTETLLEANEKQEAETILEFIRILNQDEKREFVGFMKGAKFVKGLETKARTRNRDNLQEKIAR